MSLTKLTAWLAPWWSRDGQTELDLVARRGEELLFVECTWRAGTTVDVDVLQRLREHVAASRLAGTTQPRLASASAGNFTKKLKAVAAAEGVLLWGTRDLVGR